MRAGRLSESPDHAARRSVRVRGETGETDETEEVSGTATPCTSMTAGPSAPPHRRRHAPDESSMTACEGL